MKPAKKSRGRQPLDPEGERMETHTIRTTKSDWAKFKRLGGGAWFREKVRRAKEPG